MADTKISALTVATTPLAGTEVLPIVQSGVTKQVSVADLTAGRAVSALSLSLTNALTAANGGTGQSSYAVGDILYASGATALSKLAVGASTTILTSSGTAPQWSAASGITVGTATNLAGGAGGSVPYQSAAGTTAMLAIGTAYYMLGVNAGGTAPSWQPSPTSTLTAQGDLLYASAANTLARLAKNTTATRYLSNTGTSNNPAWAQVDLTNGVTGTLPVANGGTGASSASITAFNNITGYTATGATGTTSTNLVFSTSPSITTPTLVGDSTMSTGNLIQGTANKGINFTANTAASGMTSQLLNWYEEGTWTGTLTPLTSGSITMHASIKVGAYTRIGRMVTITGTFNVASVSSPVGRLRLTGLPYSAKSGTNYDTPVSLFITGAVSSAAVMASIPNAQGFIDFYPFNTSNDTYAAQMQSGTAIVISAVYFV